MAAETRVEFQDILCGEQVCSCRLFCVERQVWICMVLCVRRQVLNSC